MGGLALTEFVPYGLFEPVQAYLEAEIQSEL
ncbi:hypothetical protein BX266_3383 [Streptomyces sp. TLI_171]|nr:hypothetical protein BX266_3383 [Streptomyces sp. TLI_171]